MLSEQRIEIVSFNLCGSATPVRSLVEALFDIYNSCYLQSRDDRALSPASAITQETIWRLGAGISFLTPACTSAVRTIEIWLIDKNPT